MGSDPAAAFPPHPDESPRHTVEVPAFRLGRTPVTNHEYAAFVRATGHRHPSTWPGGVIPPGREHHPVTYVTWDDAQAFCAWGGGALPSEAQWERAARGDDERIWPWGDVPPTPRTAHHGTATPPRSGAASPAPSSSGGPAPADETPLHHVLLEEVWISVTPVTNQQYRAFVVATDRSPPPHWCGRQVPAGLGGHPVTHVDWHDAAAFCAWAGGRLPTEAEWEKGARGTAVRRYPWGEHDPAADLAHTGAGMKDGATRRVGAAPAGASPYGLLDMSGNVWEWVGSLYRPYPYDPRDGREQEDDPGFRTLRGGSYASLDPDAVRCASRSRSAPGRRAAHIGFRVARVHAPPAPGLGGPAEPW